MMSVKNGLDSLAFNFFPLDETLDFSGRKPLFNIMVQTGNNNQELKLLKSADFCIKEINSSEGRIAVSYETPYGEGGSIRARVFLEQKELEVTVSLRVEAEGNFCIRQVQFPYVEYDSVSHFDSLMMSSPWGDNIQRPVKTIKQYCLGKSSDFWIYDYIQCGEDEVIYTYPSIMAMQYMALHNKARAVYIGCYSTASDTMTFNAKVLGKTTLALSVNHYPFLEDGTWESPLCGFAILQGDWHAAADLYASHMQHQFVPPDLPAWMKDEKDGFHGWLGIMMRLEGQEPRFRFKDLPVVYQKAAELGLNTLQIAGWTYDGFDTLYPDFDFDPKLGTQEELRKAMDDIKAMGGHAILYINGRLVDGNSNFYKNGGERSVCLDAEGNPYIERYNTSAEFRIACPACNDYISYVAGRVKRIAGDFGAHAMQVDQISCNYAYFCHDSAHEHTTPANNYLPGIEKELKAIRKVHKALNPDFFVWCEGCHERFGQFYDINQGHGEEFTWQIGESVPEQFQYNYPDYLVTGISGSFQQLCHTYSQGKPFDFYIEALEDPAFVELAKKLVAVRKSRPEYFLRGRFRDNAGLEVHEGIRAFAIEGKDGKGLLVNLWLPGAESGSRCTAVLKNPKPGWKSFTVYPESLQLKENGDYLLVEWYGPVATMVFQAE